MTYYNELCIGGKPILAPDADVKVTVEDLQSDATGRDESGYLHRYILRRGLLSWTLHYSRLTPEEYRYMEELFSGSPTVEVTWVDPKGDTKTCTAYRTGHTITVHNVRSGYYRNYGFTLQQC